MGTEVSGPFLTLKPKPCMSVLRSLLGWGEFVGSQKVVPTCLAGLCIGKTEGFAEENVGVQGDPSEEFSHLPSQSCQWPSLCIQPSRKRIEVSPKPICRSASLHVEAFIPVFSGEPFVGFLVHLVSFALEATKPWASAH